MEQLSLFPTEFVTPKKKIVISDVELISDGLFTCSSAFIQFSSECPTWVVRNVNRYMEDGCFTLKTAKII